MKKFKKLFKLQLKLLPLLGLVAIIIGIVFYEINKHSYTEISKEKFTELALENKITDFSRLGYRIEMETNSGEKYFHKFQSYSEKEEFSDIIENKFRSSSYSNNISFYEAGIPIIIGSIVLIIIVNAIIILWFVAFYNLLKSEFKENHNKWIWFFSFIILPLITPLFYMLISNEQTRPE